MNFKSFIFFALFISAVPCFAQSASYIGELAAGLTGAGLYQDIYGTGTSLHLGGGIEFEEGWQTLLVIESTRFSKIDHPNFAGDLSYENSFLTYEIQIRKRVFDSWALALGYGRISHVEKNILYEELTPGVKTQTEQVGTLESPENFYSAGLEWSTPVLDFDFFSSATYKKTSINQINIFEVLVGVRCAFK